jgi:glycosyltransferase involved in cell wall biosynthesis
MRSLSTVNRQLPTNMKVSIMMPVERLGGDAERAIASVLEQQAPFPFELIVVSAQPLPLLQTGVRNVVEPNRNPATRRNRAVSVAKGEIYAFIDDDAQAAPGWLANAAAILDAQPGAIAVGGPDPAPDDSTHPELVSETLLATPLIGSGVAAHENRRGTFDVASPSDVALVNLFVRADAFTGFDESIGYIGEDTALLEALIRRGRIVYSDTVRVFHRRRPFPGPYLRQRWRYRVKTGELLVRGSRAHRANPKIWAFLLAGTIAILAAPIAIAPYYVLTLILGARATRLPPQWWPLIPFAFAAHHATYFAGIVWGALRAVFFGAHERPTRNG